MATQRVMQSAAARFTGHFRSGAALAACVACLAVATAAIAQEKKGADKSDKDEGPAAPEDVTLNTVDSLKLAATYYAGTKGKESVPVVLLHGFKGSRKAYGELASYLQDKLGLAVLVVDLRGHGDMPTARINAATGRFGPKDVQAMPIGDMTAVMDFLRPENNGDIKLNKKPALNLNKLCIVGADMGAAVALEFARGDWSLPYQQGAWQTGRFTKALVLISPERSTKGLKVMPALNHPAVRSQLSILMFVGKESSKAMAEAKQIYGMFERYHPAPDEADQKTLYYGPLATSLQGTELLNEKSLAVPKLIAQFIDRRLIKADAAKDFKWKRLRRDPYVAEPGE